MWNDLSDAVLECAVSIIVTRWQASTVVNGRKTAQPECCKIPVMAMVAPLPYKEMQRLPEGTRAKGAKLVISPEQLYTVRTSESKQADEFSYLGIDYIIHSVADWSDLGNFYSYVATRLNV